MRFALAAALLALTAGACFRSSDGRSDGAPDGAVPDSAVPDGGNGGPCDDFPKWGYDDDGDDAYNCSLACDCASGFQDCDDSDPLRSYLMNENCSDGIDNDCDELVDLADVDCASSDAGTDAAADAAPDAGTDAAP